jgi:hypothetical protein
VNDGTLFSHLADRFVTQREDLATEALLYLLKRSEVAKQTLVQALDAVGVEAPAKISFRTQASGADGARPDLVGEDESGKQILLIESKFWAGLTEAQPVTYLQRLKGVPSGALVFVAPEKRLAVLWHELDRRCHENGIGLTQSKENQDHSRTAHTPEGACLAATTWHFILDSLIRALEAAGESAIAADARQLKALCAREDAEAFLPLESHELTGTSGRRELQFCDLVDELAQELHNRKIIDLSGLRASASKGWYGKHLKIGRLTGILRYTAWHWNVLAATPLWLRLRGPDWGVSEALNSQLARQCLHQGLDGFATPEGFEFALYPPLGVDRANVIADLLGQLETIAKVLDDVHIEGPDGEAPPPEDPTADYEGDD